MVCGSRLILAVLDSLGLSVRCMRPSSCDLREDRWPV